MGYDIARFVESTVDKDLVICPICLDVFEQPVELPECQHIFCSTCIRKCFASKKECPLDRMPVVFSSSQPRRANRSLRTIMERLRIKCPHTDKGCKEILDLAQMEHHQKRCAFKPIVLEPKISPHECHHRSCRSPKPSDRDHVDSSSSPSPSPSQQEEMRNRRTRRRYEGEGESYIGIWLTICFIIVLIFTLFRRR